jgi:hypothetical protein
MIRHKETHMGTKNRTLVYLMVEWESGKTPDPRKWDWQAIVEEGGNGETVTDTGSIKLPDSLPTEEMMEAVSRTAFDTAEEALLFEETKVGDDDEDDLPADDDEI